MLRVIFTGLVCCGLTAGLGYLLLPVLRALKAGQSILAEGPIWHNYKSGEIGGRGELLGKNRGEHRCHQYANHQ